MKFSSFFAFLLVSQTVRFVAHDREFAILIMSRHLVISGFICSSQLTLYSHHLHSIHSDLMILYCIRPFHHASFIANHNLFVRSYSLVGKTAGWRKYLTWPKRMGRNVQLLMGEKEETGHRLDWATVEYQPCTKNLSIPMLVLWDFLYSAEYKIEIISKNIALFKTDSLINCRF